MIELKKATDSELFLIYDDMKKQFPECELKSYDVFSNLTKQDDYLPYIAMAGTSEVGYCILYKERLNNILWLDYIAVFKNFHSKGFGKQILQNIQTIFPSVKGIYLEVEKPDANEPDTFRRIKFYKSFGAKLLNCNYFYPNKEGSYPMDLYFLPLNTEEVPSKKEIVSTVKNVLLCLHKDISHLNSVIDKIN